MQIIILTQNNIYDEIKKINSRSACSCSLQELTMAAALEKADDQGRDTHGNNLYSYFLLVNLLHKIQVFYNTVRIKYHSHRSSDIVRTEEAR
jgi:hypothetical protein